MGSTFEEDFAFRQAAKVLSRVNSFGEWWIIYHPRLPNQTHDGRSFHFRQVAYDFLRGRSFKHVTDGNFAGWTSEFTGWRSEYTKKRNALLAASCR